MNKDEFIKGYCEKSEIAIDEYKEYFVTLPCNCGKDNCKGWATVNNNPASIKSHKELYS